MSLSQVTIIILTYNEEKDIENCLLSAYNWAEDIYVVDSYSVDQTVEIAKQYTQNILQNHWVSFAQQRQWAIENINLRTEWVFFLDADERLTDEIKREINNILKMKNIQNGFYIKRRFFFLGRWLKHGGYYPLPEIRMMRWKNVQFLDEGGGARERFIVNGATGTLKSDILHIYNKGIINWVDKHKRLAALEAENECLNLEKVQFEKFIGKIGSSTWLRAYAWPYLPRSIRPALLFFYRYFLRLGFLDGLAGFYYCALHDFWYPLLLDILIYEKKTRG